VKAVHVQLTYNNLVSVETNLFNQLKGFDYLRRT